MSKYPTGMIPSPMDINDYRLGEFMDLLPESEMPDGFLVSPFKSIDELPVFDQASSQTCVAQALSWAEAQKQLAETGGTVDEFKRLSPGWIYANRLATDTQGEGMVPRNALAQLVAEGTPPYDKFPEIGAYSKCLSLLQARKEALLPLAKPNRALSYVNLVAPVEVKAALMTTGAVPIGIKVFDNFYDVSKTTGIVVPPSGDCVGGHMMTVVGWQMINGKTHWIVVNSWGRDWGLNGICYMPHDYSAIKELWCLTDMQKKTLKAAVPAQIISGTFVVPVRTMVEALGAEVQFNTALKTARAIIPPCLQTRMMTIVQGSNDITVEVVE